jgi:hypothetical protein
VEAEHTQKKEEIMQRSQLISSSILVTLLMLILWGISPVLAQQVQVDTQQGKVGETVTFTVSLDKATKTIDALGVILTYDPTVLRYAKTFTKGPLVQEFDFFDVHERQPGEIRVGGFTTKQAIPVEGGGKLVSLTFTVLSASNTTVQIARMVDDLAGIHAIPGTFTGQAGAHQDSPPASTPANQPEPPTNVPTPPAPTSPDSTPPRQGLRLMPYQSPKLPVTARSAAPLVSRIEAAQVNSLLERGAALLIMDVRSPAAFQRAHIRGAVSMSLADLAARHTELPRDTPIVTYCA